MRADQAIFTSLVRRGKSGYHLVARSPGITDSEASAISTWSPSHGGLLVDGVNRSSINFFPLPTGRFSLSRTIEGGAEYSGRGARQLYTHAAVVGGAEFCNTGCHPFSLYRDAMALGHLAYQSDPDPVLKTIELSSIHLPPNDQDFADLARELHLLRIEKMIAHLNSGRPLVIPYAGDRSRLAEHLVSRLSRDSILKVSFATSLVPSAVRPYQLNLVAAS
ncbi:MAG: hypothetical protein NVSMB9_36130 [Isosphaeraceae bacterium]